MSKRCVVTGAAGGIGLAIAEALVARGARVLLVDLAEETVAAVQAIGRGAINAASSTFPASIRNRGQFSQ